MRILSGLTAIFLACMAMVSCNEESSETFIYSVGNSMNLNTHTNAAEVMNYAESTVDMSSAIMFTGTQSEADAAADKEFTKRMQAVDQEKFCSMMAEGDYYDFILYRASKNPGEQAEINRKHFSGTKTIR